MPMTKINWQKLKFNMVYKPIQNIYIYMVYKKKKYIYIYRKNVQYGWLREMMISSS